MTMCSELATEIAQELKPGERLTLTRESWGRLTLWKGPIVLMAFGLQPDTTFDRRVNDVFIVLNEVKFLCGHPSRQSRMRVEIERRTPNGTIGEVLIQAHVFEIPDEDDLYEDNESASRLFPAYSTTD